MTPDDDPAADSDVAEDPEALARRLFDLSGIESSADRLVVRPESSVCGLLLNGKIGHPVHPRSRRIVALSARWRTSMGLSAKDADEIHVRSDLCAAHKPPFFLRLSKIAGIALADPDGSGPAAPFLDDLRRCAARLPVGGRVLLLEPEEERHGRSAHERLEAQAERLRVLDGFEGAQDCALALFEKSGLLGPGQASSKTAVALERHGPSLGVLLSSVSGALLDAVPFSLPKG